MKLVRIALGLLTVLWAGSVPADGLARPPGRTVADIVALLDQYKPDPSRVAQLRAILDRPLPATEDRHDLADAHFERARAAMELGAVQKQIAELHKAIEYGAGSENLGRAYKELSAAELQGGRFRNAIEAREQAIAQTPGANRGQTMSDYVALADIHRRLGDAEGAKKAMDLARSIYSQIMRGRNAGTYGKIWTSSIESGEAYLLYGQGRYGEAETHMRKSLELLGEDMNSNLQRLAAHLNTPPQVQLEANREFLLMWIAEIERQQGKLYEAEVTIREALRSTLSRVGRDAPNTGNALVVFSRILNTQGRSREADIMARQSIAIYDQLGTPTESYFRNQAQLQLATALSGRGQWRESVATFEALVADTAGDPQYQSQLKRGNLVWATALVRIGRANEATTMLRSLVARDSQWLGPRHFQTAEMRGMLGVALAKTGDRVGALKEFRFAVPLLLSVNLEEERSPGRLRRLALVLETYIALLAEIRGSELEKAEKLDAAAEAFQLADALRGQETQAAVAAAALRGITGSGELGDLIRREQDLRQEATSLRRILTDLMAAPTDQQLPKVIAEMKARLGAIAVERKAIRERLEKSFPDYADLVNPRPAGIEDARAALKPGEALVSTLVTGAGTFLWAVPRQGAVIFAASPMNAAQAAALVAKLRSAVDPGDVDLDRAPAFDLAAAHELYRQTLAPLEAGWKGAENLLVVASGALSQLPFGLLTTAPAIFKPEAVSFAHLRQAPWLIRQVAVTQLPSVNAFVTLRRAKPGAADREMFMGFGDPDFGGAQLAQGVAQAATRRVKVRNLFFARVTRDALAAGRDVAWTDYSRIPPLPDTREEILAIAKALGADPGKDVLLGREASRENVQKADLSHRRIIAFATHGLLAGDFPGVDEPSLALANPGRGKNGLLTLEDILALKLDADWVVLSACNTAAGDGAGADAVSGLGRGFFYAGSRALLVTHWPVETVSARLLVTGLFTRYSRDPNLTRAEALRQSMLAVMDSPGPVDPVTKKVEYSYAHPLFWAPYALVGDGGGR